MNVKSTFEHTMYTIFRYSNSILRISLAIVFFWFGALKVIDASPAQELVGQAAEILIPFHFPGFIYFLGYWEMLIGVFLLFHRTLMYGIALLFLQMLGAMSPLIILPEVSYTHFPFELTMEGQYIIKNLVLISAAIVSAKGEFAWRAAYPFMKKRRRDAEAIDAEVRPANFQETKS